MLKSTATSSWTWWVWMSYDGQPFFFTGKLFFNANTFADRIRTVPTLASWKCSSSLRARCLSHHQRKVVSVRRRRGRQWNGAPLFTCPRTLQSTCTSVLAPLPVRSSRRCWRSSQWWIILASSLCLSAASATTRVLLTFLLVHFAKPHVPQNFARWIKSCFACCSLHSQAVWQRAPPPSASGLWTQWESAQFCSEGEWNWRSQCKCNMSMYERDSRLWFLFYIFIRFGFSLPPVACLLHAWAEELPAHSAAGGGGTHQADNPAVCSSPHQDARSAGWLDSRLRRVCDRDSIMRPLAGCWPQPAIAASLIPESMTQNTSSVKERVSQGARQLESASANVRMRWCERWEVPYTRRVWCAWERMSWEKWRLADKPFGGRTH